MFGYVTANEPELKVKDYHKYKAYYCGLCQSLKRQYGSAGQLTLAYDMTFVIILLTSLYESETKAESHRCKMHPLKPQPMLENEITEYAADMNLIMAYYHLEDDWKDEKKVAGLLGSMALKRKIEKAIPRCNPNRGINLVDNSSAPIPSIKKVPCTIFRASLTTPAISMEFTLSCRFSRCFKPIFFFRIIEI